MNALSDALREQYLKLPYNDIINSCQSKLVTFCDDPVFWLGKIEFEVSYYNVYFYDKYEFLREALRLGYFKYFEALLSNKKLIPADDDRINRLLFKYGYITDNVKLMKQYARSPKSGIIRLYKTYGARGFDEIDDIIKNGVVTIDEIYELMKLILKNNDRGVLGEYDTPSPVRYHPRIHIFDKLILRYIGYSNDSDLKRFEALAHIYSNFLSTYKRLFNLIHDTYETSTFNAYITKVLYSDLDEFTDNMKMWIEDDVDKFKRKPIRHIEQLMDNFEKRLPVNMLLELPFHQLINLCYHKGKIINYIVRDYVRKNRLDNSVINFLAAMNIDTSQFKIGLNNLDKWQFETLVVAFFTWLSPVHNRDSNRLQKVLLIVEHPYFKTINPGMFTPLVALFGWHDYYGQIDRDISIIIREKIVQPSMEEYKLDISDADKYLLIQQ